jgi:hypothetical protein
MKENNKFNLGLENIWEVVCYDSNGAEKWREENENLITTEGLNDILTKYLKGSSYTATWFVGLAGAGTKAAADTMSSHSGWAVVAAYSEGVRQTLTLGTASAGSISNTASKAVFTITGSATVAGAFVTSNSTKSGTTGTLYGVVDFGDARAVISGDTLTVTVTLTAASA